MTTPGLTYRISEIARWRLGVRGIVQGVGFRPFVYGLACRLRLVGFVRNDGGGVTIEVEGPGERLHDFYQALLAQAPPLSQIDSVMMEPLAVQGDESFLIARSEATAGPRTLVSPDSSTCEACLRELFDPTDRRHGYPFINCTHCGPRFTIIRDLPYDRPQTTMAPFTLCPACQVEYENPLDRRFHAQPNACPACGPTLALTIMEPTRFDQPGPSAPDTGEAVTIDRAVRALAAGGILAIKGLGGYHLACDGGNQEAVARLRQRKRRAGKPFALMVADLAGARALCEIDEREAQLLQSRRRPIVLLRRREGSPVAEAVAPGYRTLGLMLPYTPLHHLLLRALARLQPGRAAVLVMTSGNRSEEPITYRDEEARERLAPLVDGLLAHNRAIHMRCDDSVTRVVAGGEQLFRRARGYVPEPIRLVHPWPRPLLACGGQLKNSFCLGKGQQALMSHHIGDLDNVETLTAFREGIEHFQRLFEIWPEIVAHDLHPDYLATRYALESEIPRKVAVQHHHAHIASVMAEHGLEGAVIGVAADGTGYGSDGAIWGGEVMVVEPHRFERVAHLAYVPLPGGEQAIRQPWRMAATYLAASYGTAFLELDLPFVRRLDPARWRPLARMIERGLNSPPTSSLGRLFDAVAALLGLRAKVEYEGQAAIELEMQAASGSDLSLYPFLIEPGDPARLDVRPLIRAVVEEFQRGVPLPLIARRFHLSVAEMLVEGCQHAREQSGLERVALSGGVFQNRLLLEQLIARLEARSFQVYINRRVPANDGGLSLGQALVAAARVERE